MRTLLLTIAFASTGVPALSAQDALVAKRPVEREIASGHHPQLHDVARPWRLRRSMIDARDVVVVAEALLPDGTRFRGVVAPPTGRRPFSLVAEAGGVYALKCGPPRPWKRNESGEQGVGKGPTRFRWTRYSPPPSVLRLFRHRTSCQSINPQSAGAGESGPDGHDRLLATCGTERTPVVSPIEKDNGSTLVAFLWRGGPSTRNVVVLGSFAKPPFTDYVLKRIEETRTSGH